MEIKPGMWFHYKAHNISAYFGIRYLLDNACYKIIACTEVNNQGEIVSYPWEYVYEEDFPHYSYIGVCLSDVLEEKYVQSK